MGSDTADPLARMEDCHARLRRQLAALVGLARRLPEHGHDDVSRAAARAILRAFDTTGELHRDDEESGLLPRVRERVPASATLVARLQREHRDLELRWRELRPLLSGIAAGRRAALPPKLAIDFDAGYRAHMAAEEDELLPLAAEVLDAADLAALNREMDARRPRG